MKAQLTKEPGWKIVIKIKSGEIAAEEYISSVFDQIQQKNRTINAYNTLMKKRALQMAKRLDRRIRKGERVGELCGLGVAVKDNIWIKSFETTCSSKALRGYMPPSTATVVQRIERADGIVLGKANMDEFAMGSKYPYNSCFGAVHNPPAPFPCVIVYGLC